MIVAAALTGVAASGAACSTHSQVSPAVVNHFKGLPAGCAGASSQTPRACSAWRDAHSIYVITWGSDSCPTIPTSVDATSARKVVIRTVEHDFIEGDNSCTDDLTPSTSVVRLPSTIDGTKSLLVKVGDTSTRLSAHPT